MFGRFCSHRHAHFCYSSILPPPFALAAFFMIRERIYADKEARVSHVAVCLFVYKCKCVYFLPTHSTVCMCVCGLGCRTVEGPDQRMTLYKVAQNITRKTQWNMNYRLFTCVATGWQYPVDRNRKERTHTYFVSIQLRRIFYFFGSWKL